MSSVLLKSLINHSLSALSCGYGRGHPGKGHAHLDRKHLTKEFCIDLERALRCKVPCLCGVEGKKTYTFGTFNPTLII